HSACHGGCWVTRGTNARVRATYRIHGHHLQRSEESNRGSGKSEPTVESVRVTTMLSAGDLDARAMMLACSHSTNRRAVWHIGDEFGADQACDLASRLRKEKAARAAWQRAAKSTADIGLA